MATLRELIIKISANSQSFQNEISRASRMGSDYYRVMQDGGRQAASAQRETQRALASVTAQLNSTRSAAMGMAGAFAGAFATHQLIAFADTWNQLNGRLKLASSSSDDFAASQRVLMDISQRTGTSLEANSNLYSRIAQSLRDAGYASADVAKVTETVATSLKLSGASTAEASSVITQLSQALGSGVLRGEEFNSIMENGGRLARLLADGLGTTVGGLRAMAQNGELTTDKIVPLLTNVEILRKEFDTLPASVSGSTQKVQNALLAWVGGADAAVGASSTLAGILDSVAKNINTLATVTGGLIAVGLARYLGNMALGATSATAALVTATKSEIALAEAQFRGTQIATARARAAVYRAQQALVAARGTDAQAAAEKRLAATQALLARNTAARTAAQTALNNVTSVGSRLMSGALGLVGGIPGLVMLGAGAWYAMYQNQEQARKSAQEYASKIDEIREKTRQMSLPETADNGEKTRQALNEQNRLIGEQAEKVRQIKTEIAGYQKMLANPGVTINGYMINHLTSVDDATRGLADATSTLAVEQERLSQMQAKSESIQSVLEGVEHRRVVLIRQQAAEQNSAYQSLVMMNGQNTEFNRLLGLGNTLLAQRQGLVNAPLRIPQTEFSDKQKAALEKSRRDLELSRLKGEARERLRLSYVADDLNLTNDPQFQTGRQELINNGLAEWKNNEAGKSKAKPKGPKTEGEKTEDVYKRLIKQQQEQIALAGTNTELAKMKYQVTQGELASLEKSRKETLLQNAALIDQKDIAEQLKTFRDGLADTNDAARNRGNIDFLGAGMGDKARDRMKEMADIRTDFTRQQNELQRDFSRGQISEDLYRKQTEALKEALDERLEIQKDYYKKSDEQQSDWRSGVTDALMNYADQAADLSSVAATATSEILNNTTSSIASNLTGVLTTAKTFKDGMSGIFTSLGETVIHTMIQMATQALITRTIMASFGGGGGLFGSLFGGASSAASGAGAMGMSTSFAAYANAKGGVYDSPSLSSYSNGVYSTPQYFAFAKGAGVFGEAGPEAIMPLTRGADGSLGVRAVGRQSAAIEAAAQQIESQPRITVHVSAPNTFTGKPDDATLLAIDKRTEALGRLLVDSLTSEVMKPQNKFGRAIYSNLQPKKPK